MFGKGDRTEVDVSDSAGPETPGITSSKSKSKPDFAEGGTKQQAVEGAELAVPLIPQWRGLRCALSAVFCTVLGRAVTTTAMTSICCSKMHPAAC